VVAKKHWVLALAISLGLILPEGVRANSDYSSPFAVGFLGQMINCNVELVGDRNYPALVTLDGSLALFLGSFAFGPDPDTGGGTAQDMRTLLKIFSGLTAFGLTYVYPAYSGVTGAISRDSGQTSRALVAGGIELAIPLVISKATKSNGTWKFALHTNSRSALMTAETGF
jgi:hypothetical protein